MEAIELRIGNLVYNTIWKENKEIKKSNFMMLDYQIEINIIKPIPLTNEWFLNCKSNSIFNNGFDYKKTSTGRFEIYVGMSLITVIGFVHELQNLNFALLGEDLIFNT